MGTVAQMKKDMAQLDEELKKAKGSGSA